MNTKKLTTSEFIERAKKVHGNKYDYLKVDYINDYTKVEIICLIHGSFWQQPGSHVRQKSGCWECSYLTRNKNRKGKPFTKEKFVEDAKKVHGNKYDYSKVNYVNSNVKVEIICPIHGSFWQQPNGHVNSGYGCDLCGKLRTKNSLEEFIIKANAIHNNKYDYSKSVYYNNKVKLEIICPIHGSFWQRPSNHTTNKTGCPKCKKSFGERKIEKFLLINDVNFEEQKTFFDCINKDTGKNLYFDFYLQKNNLLIEYDGRQHFEVIEHFGGIKRLIKIKNLDKIKNEFAKESGYKMLRISYENYKNIEEILTRNILQ